MQRGLDISSVSDNGKIDWQAVRASGISFVIMRGAYGASIDPSCERYRNGLVAAGIETGLYLFLRWDKDPEAQARKFCDAFRDLRDVIIPPWLDVEFKDRKRPPGMTVEDALKRIETAHTIIEESFGTCGIYSSAGVWSECLGNRQAEFLSDSPLWVCWWREGKPKLPRPWPDYWIQQDDGDCPASLIPGFKRGVVDTNTFNTLYRGCKGDRVKWLQRILRLRSSLTVDGVFGRATEEALRRFQDARGLVADGIVGPRTFVVLSSE